MGDKKAPSLKCRGRGIFRTLSDIYVELFSENRVVNYFRKKVSSQIFVRVLDTYLGCKNYSFANLADYSVPSRQLHVQS